jgi:hypothetical protein
MVVVGFGLNTATLPRGLTNRHLYFNDSGDTSALCEHLGFAWQALFRRIEINPIELKSRLKSM